MVEVAKKKITIQPHENQRKKHIFFTFRWCFCVLALVVVVVVVGVATLFLLPSSLSARTFMHSEQIIIKESTHRILPPNI